MRAGRMAAGSLIGAVVIATAYGARRPCVPAGEAALFRMVNDATDAIERPVWVVTQTGSLGSVLVTSAFVGRRRGRREAMVVLAVGSGTWVGCKLIKPLIGRGRPDRVLDDVTIRGRPAGGLGYPSGHAAVAMALALVVTRRPRSRSFAAAGATVVGIGRIYLGAHLPLDVGGGLAVGAGAAAVGAFASREHPR